MHLEPAQHQPLYLSALHVRLTAPEGYDGARALAVAPEPWPFWDGEDQDERVARWSEDVGWREDWGQVIPAGRLNGSSGVLVGQRVLEPLDLTFDDVWLTDAVPFFFVHRGVGRQGDAMSKRYDPFAAAVGLPPHALPDRPTPRRLVELAVTEERARLEKELQTADAPLVITLGNEALAVADALLDADLPNQLSPDHSYGTRLPARLGGQRLEVLPLVHPGQRGAPWTAAHDTWIERPPA